MKLLFLGRYYSELVARKMTVNISAQILNYANRGQKKYRTSPGIVWSLFTFTNDNQRWQTTMMNIQILTN